MRGAWKQFRFFITDTFRSRKGSVPVDPSLGQTLRDASAIGRAPGGAAGSEAAGRIASKGTAAYTKSLKKEGEI